MRRRARRPRAGRATRGRASETCRSSSSSLAAPSRRRSPSSTAESLTASAERPGRLVFAVPGALDGEVAFLAGSVSKGSAVQRRRRRDRRPAGRAGGGDRRPAHAARSRSPGRRIWKAWSKRSRLLARVCADARDVILSGRVGARRRRARRTRAAARERQGRCLGAACSRGSPRSPSRRLRALRCSLTVWPAGRSAALVDTLGIREASGTVLDHLYVISQAAARARLGIA